MSTLTLAFTLQLSVLGLGAQSYDDAYHKAVNEDRPLVLLVGADWCPACRTMKQTVLPKVQKSGGLDKVAFTIINTDEQRNIADKVMSGGSIPQLIVYRKTSDGWKRDQLTGSQSVADVTAFINRGLEESSSDIKKVSVK